jgi:hypothetical protein
MRLVGHMACMTKKRNVFSDMVEKAYRKRTLGIPGLSWVIETDLT